MRFLYFLFCIFSIACSCDKPTPEKEPGIKPEISSISIESAATYDIDLTEINLIYSIPIQIKEDVKITLGNIPVTLLSQNRSLKISFKNLEYGKEYTLKIPKGAIVNKSDGEPADDYSISFFTKKQIIIGSGMGPLSVDGQHLVNEKGEVMRLRGVSYGWHNWWPRFYNEGTVKTFAEDWNCNVVRAAMGVEPSGAYLSNPEKGIDCVTTVVDAAIKEGIYVIIDWHSHNILEEDAKTFFDKMVKKYKGVPNVIYEIFNEPDYQSWKEIKEYAIEIIKVIRNTDPNAIIIVGTPNWDQDVNKVADDPITGYSNIIYTLHFYAGAHGETLRDKAEYAISKKLPLFVSECGGMGADGDGPINHIEWTKWIEWMDDHSLSWLAWSIADKNETCSMLKPTASSTGNWKDTDIKEWGQVVKTELTKE